MLSFIPPQCPHKIKRVIISGSREAFLIQFFLFIFYLQSMIARKMLEFQLRRLGIFEAEEIISSHPNFDNSFKICNAPVLINNILNLGYILASCYNHLWPIILLKPFHHSTFVSSVG